MDLSHPKLSKKSSTDTDPCGDKLQIVEINTKSDQLSTFEINLVNAMVYFNETIIEASERLFKEFSRRVYVTPSSFLEMLNLFKELYNRKHIEITTKRERYTLG